MSYNRDAQMLEPASVFAAIGYGDGLRLELEGAIFLLQPAWQRATMGGARCWNRQGHELRRAAGHAGTSKAASCDGRTDGHAGTGKAASCKQRGAMLEPVVQRAATAGRPCWNQHSGELQPKTPGVATGRTASWNQQ